EGVHPVDGGWTSSKGQAVLLLSIPEFEEIISSSFDTFDYAWLYHSKLEAYILCFQLSSDIEKAILFGRKHAGRLLMDAEAYEPFNIAITSHSLQEMDEKT